MSIQNKLSELKDQKSYSIPAKRVMEHLKPILSKSDSLQIRWMWELLQNASDLGNNIKAKFIISDKTITFKHNGPPFTLDEAYNLVMPDSGKDGEEIKKKSVIGQFGTGFISTHILSKKIKVAGIVEDDEELYEFNFLLDRSERTDKEFLIESIKMSEKQYRESLTKIDELPTNEFQTIITYFLDDVYDSLDSEEVLSRSIESFKALIPYVLAFRPQLEEIIWIDKRENDTKYIFKREEIESEIESVSIIETTCLKGNEATSVQVGLLVNSETTIAFPVKKISRTIFKLRAFPPNCPKLFCAFPMIGTEKFNFPVIVQSETFTPNEARDGIELTEHDADNRKRLIEAKNAYKSLLEIASKHKWTNAYNLCFIANSEIDDEKIRQWFVKDIFTPIKDAITIASIVEIDSSLNVENHRKTLREIYIPYGDKRKVNKIDVVKTVYDFAFKTIPEKIPSKSQFLKWYEKIDFDVFSSEKMDIKQLCALTMDKDKATKLSSFSEKYKLNEVESTQYLIDLVEFIISEEENELLNTYGLVLNQKDELVKLKGLKLDRISHRNLKEGYGEKLKDIYNSLSSQQDDCKTNLLNKKFETIEGLIDENDAFDFDTLAKNTDDKLKNFDGNFKDEKFLYILKELFQWFTTCGISQDTLTKLFSYFDLNKSQLYLNTKTPEQLEFAFDIELSGKSEILARLANSSISNDDLEIIASHPELISSFVEWLNKKQEDNPDEELGDIGEEFVHKQLCDIFGADRVRWEDKQEYDFLVLESDKNIVKYFIDAKTTGSGIANSNNVPFFMRTAQWNFLEEQRAFDKYIIARVFNNSSGLGVKYIKLDIKSL